MKKRRVSVWSLFALLMLVAMPLSAAEKLDVRAVLGVSPGKSHSAVLLRDSATADINVGGDTYSQAPLVQDSSAAHYASSLGGPCTHTFDGASESGGSNLLGTAGGSFEILEGTTDLGGGNQRILVEVTALSAGADAEPWVDESQSDAGYLAWRLDVGSILGGANPIEPDTSFTVLDSGVNLFDSSGSLVATLDLLEDNSDTSGLAGVAIISRANDANIAGIDIATLQMFWNIYPQAPEYSSNPVAGSTLDFGDQQINSESAELAVQVSNEGDGNLTLACSLSGANPADFNLGVCATPVAPAAMSNVTVACEPETIGEKSAVLTITSNDADESENTYNLICNGTEPPGENVIFANGFEQD
jgi:hypothetical protein